MILSVPLESPSPLKDVQLEEEQQKPHIFKSRFPDITINATVPLHNYLFEKGYSVPDRPCLIAGETGRIYTYDETILMCKRTAAGLKKIGVGKCDTIMLVLHNCPEFVFSFMAASMIGAASSTANPFYTAGELSKQMKYARAKTVITHSKYVEKFRVEGGEDLVIVTVDDPPEGCVGFADVCKGDVEGNVECEVDVDAPVAIPFSSGTTGLPKGVVLTHRGQITNVAQQVDGENPHLHLSEDDVVLCVLPLFHVFSLNSVLFCSLRRGAAVVLMQKFEINTMLELIHKHKISFAAVVPPLVIALAKNPIVCDYDLTSIRLVLCGAAPLGKELEQTLQKRMPNAILGQGYGMTEAGPVLTMCAGFAKQPLTVKGGSVGTVVRNAELKIIDPKDGRSLGYNKPGEICIRGQQIMKEYLNDPVATASTIDVDGWLHSGDIGYVDEDDEVFIVDRVKEIIKYKGFQVAPAELEALLISHASVVDAAVVPLKDENCGEVPVAFVVKSSEGDVKEEEIKEFVAKEVIFYKRIHKVFFVESIPKSPSGKILRKELRESLASDPKAL